MKNESNLGSLISQEYLFKYHGKDQIWNLYTNLMTEDMLYSISDLDKYYKVFPGSLNVWVDAYKRNKNKQGRDIVADSKIARELARSREYSGRYHLKILPKSKYFAKSKFYDYLITKNRVVIIKEEKNEVYASLITDSNVIDSSIEFFNTIWTLLPEPR